MLATNLYAMCEICEERRPDCDTVILGGSLRVRRPLHRPLGTEPVSAEEIWDAIHQPLELTALNHRCVVLEADGRHPWLVIELKEDALKRWRDGECPHCVTVFRSRHKFDPVIAVLPVVTA